ncbi:hypothetical protein OIV83_000684 [Microbotryomycetes sp. JL201]|nr:hypothetical protein OIV83_000684 [Microbotryomycetes sp. JL201]
MSHNKAGQNTTHGPSSQQHQQQHGGNKKQQQQSGSGAASGSALYAAKRAAAAAAASAAGNNVQPATANSLNPRTTAAAAPATPAPKSPVVTGGWASVAAAGASKAKAATSSSAATPTSSQPHSKKSTPTATPPPGPATATPPASNKFVVGGVDLSTSLSLPLQVTLASGPDAKGRQFDGTLYTFDARSSLIVLCSPATSTKTTSVRPDASNFRIINTRHVKTIKVLSTTRNRSTVPDVDVTKLPMPTVAELNARADKAVQQDVIRRSKIGPEGVSRQAQQLFDALSKTLPVRWHGKSFVVMDSVMVEEPYRAQDVKGGKDAAQYVERVRKVQQQSTASTSTDAHDGVARWPVYERWSVSAPTAGDASQLVQDWHLRGHVVLDGPDFASFEPLANYQRPQSFVSDKQYGKTSPRESLVVQIGVDPTGDSDGGAELDMKRLHFVQKSACQLAVVGTSDIVDEGLDLWIDELSTNSESGLKLEGIAYTIRNEQASRVCDSAKELPSGLVIQEGRALAVRERKPDNIHSTRLAAELRGPPLAADQAQSVRVDAEGKVLPPPAEKRHWARLTLYTVICFLLDGVWRIVAQPKRQLEQYVTSAHLASRMIFTAATQFDDIQDKRVVDLGCGCAVLSAACVMMGASSVLGIDADKDALEIAKQNVDSLEMQDEVTLSNALIGNVEPAASISANKSRAESSDQEVDMTGVPRVTPDMIHELAQGQVDTVVMNPPFGTWNKGIDMVFLEMACQVATTAVYSLNKKSTRDFILKKAKSFGFSGQVIAEMRYDLPKTMSFHKKQSVDIEVDMWRFERV